MGSTDIKGRVLCRRGKPEIGFEGLSPGGGGGKRPKARVGSFLLVPVFGGRINKKKLREKKNRGPGRMGMIGRKTKRQKKKPGGQLGARIPGGGGAGGGKKKMGA